jgi:hypothetical protein
MTSIKMARRVSLLSLVATIFALLLAQTAFATNASVDTYGGNGGNVQSQIDPTAQSSPAQSSASSPGTGGLPFTGLDLGLAAGGAVVLLAAGAAMATVAARRTRAE